MLYESVYAANGVLPLIAVCFTLTLEERSLVISYSCVEFGIYDANPLNQHQLGRINFASKYWQSKEKSIGQEVGATRSFNARQERVIEMPYERINLRLSERDASVNQ